MTKIDEPALINRIRQCECPARDGTAHVAIEIHSESVRLTICLGPSQAEATARSIAEAAHAAGIKFDGGPVICACTCAACTRLNTLIKPYRRHDVDHPECCKSLESTIRRVVKEHP